MKPVCLNSADGARFWFGSESWTPQPGRADRRPRQLGVDPETTELLCSDNLFRLLGLEVLQLAVYGRATAAIATELYLSPATVKRHFERAYARLEVSDRVAAVAEAMRRGRIT